MLALLKNPTYIAIAVLLVLLGVQTWRLSASKLETAQAVLAKTELVADIATARAEGEVEGARRLKEAQDELNAEHARIVSGLEADKAALKKSYDNTYNMLREFAGTERWGCLKDPLPENILEQFRR